MNRLKQIFTKQKPLLSIYFTAGYPTLESTLDLALALENAGADFLEIGFPYSDPVADGPAIQASSQAALRNGMTLKVLFQQLSELRQKVSIPVLLMGYVNPMLQFGVENFCREAQQAGVDGVIVPDLPMYEYEALYRDCFEKHGLSNIFLVSPQTSEDRIRKIDELTNGFIYLLSSSATTGKNLDTGQKTDAYFARIKSMSLKNPVVVGFGITDSESFAKAAEYTDGAIVGSAFVRLLAEPGFMDKIPGFIQDIRG